MNRESATKLLAKWPVIKAYAEGADIEYLKNGKWRHAQYPIFNPDRDYRVKPKKPIIGILIDTPDFPVAVAAKGVELTPEVRQILTDAGVEIEE